jgi:hypothetical protein
MDGKKNGRGTEIERLVGGEMDGLVVREGYWKDNQIVGKRR